MTEDQIKAIAKKYANDNGGNIVFPIRIIAEDMLLLLNKRYCIVEREKVMELYKEARNRFNHKQVFTSAEGMIELGLLEQIFGISMFNQNEE